MTKIVHLTSAHPRYDTRIFVKMCSSLARRSDFHVSLVVADGLGNEMKNGVSIIDVGKTDGGRLSRMTKTVQKVYKQAYRIDADIYHLHDPELIPIGLLLKKKGKKVIFDAHEDLPAQIYSKPYIAKPFQFILSHLVTLFEHLTCSRFNAIVTATPYIREKFLLINPRSVDINNFPILEEFHFSDYSDKQNKIVYIGLLASSRGILEIVKSLRYAPSVSLDIAGKFCESDTENAVKALPEWKCVDELGFLNRYQISHLLEKSKIGLVTLHPTQSYQVSLPVKMFEYMASGIAVIASDFPLWRGIIEKYNCGICVDPLDPKAIGDAITYLINHPTEAEKMGKNGRNATETIYNWKLEEKKLFNLYDQLSNTDYSG